MKRAGFLPALVASVALLGAPAVVAYAGGYGGAAARTGTIEFADDVLTGSSGSTLDLSSQVTLSEPNGAYLELGGAGADASLEGFDSCTLHANTASIVLEGTGLTTWTANATRFVDSTARDYFIYDPNGLLGGIDFLIGVNNDTIQIDDSSNLISLFTNGTLRASIDSSGLTMNALPVSASRLTSTVATGTPPFTVASTTKVANLNADTLDGVDSTGFLTSGTVSKSVWLQSPHFVWTSKSTPGSSTNIGGGQFSASATNCRDFVWVVPSDYASGLTFRGFSRADAGAADANIIRQLNVYEWTQTASAAVLPAACYASGNTTVSHVSQSSGDLLNDAAFTPSGCTLNAGDVYHFEWCRMGADASDTSTLSDYVLGALLTYTANKGF